jgi:hypothetical protein
VRPNESNCERAVYGLGEVERGMPFEADPGLALLVGELDEWLEDDRQWLGAFTHQWVSLLDDVVASRHASGPSLSDFVEQSAAAWAEIGACRSVLKKSKHGKALDPSIRRRLQRAVRTISEQLLERGALSAAWDDLLAATDFLSARIQARRLFGFIEAQGLDSRELTKSLRELLEDEKATVKMARGESSEREDHNQRAGLSIPERVGLGHALLAAPPRQAETVIWLRYTLSPLRAGRLKLGDAVEIFSAAWLRETLAGEGVEHLPRELREDKHGHLALLANVPPGGDEDDGPTPKEEEEIPEALVRVALGQVSTSEALALARETAELIVSLASLQGADPSIWLLTDSYVRFYNGREAGASFHAPPVMKLSLEHRQALKSDSMPEFVEEWASDLPAGLPLLRRDLRQAARLALWLRRSRDTWEPGRIVLCDRIFEQVGGWAGMGDRRRFCSEFLRISWALQRVRREITNCWHGLYAARLNLDPTLKDGAWEEIKANPGLDYQDGELGRHHFNLSGVIRQIDFLLERVTPDTPLHERLTRLKSRTATGQTVAAWIEELMHEFDAFQQRERRVRNALVHGGPVSDEMAASVLLFVDWLAADALHTAIKGLLAESDLVDYFLDRRADHEKCLVRLRGGDDPADALFW